MAMTAAERKRQERARKRQAGDSALEATRPYCQTPFFEFFGDHPDALNFDMALDTAGIEPPALDDDRGPASRTGQIEAGSPDAYSGFEGSIGRAEVIIGALLDAADELAAIVNAYKRQEIDRAVAELEESTISDVEQRRRVVSELIVLRGLQRALAGTYQRRLPRWKVKLG